jgi:glucosamine kinase
MRGRQVANEEIMTILAVADGGATGARVRLHDATHAPLAESTAGPASLTLGVEQTWGNLESAIRDAMRSAGLEMRRHVDLHLAVGLAGGRSPENCAAFRAKDPLGCKSITIVTDGYASLIGALGDGPGIALAIGTGVTGYALRKDGSVDETSGWGFPAGDEGGGAWIGWRALQAFTKWWDHRITEESLIFRTLPERIGEDFDAIQSWLLTARSTEFASLAPYVVDAAKEGDRLAERILDDAVGEHELVIGALDTVEGGPIALLGGLAQVFEARFREEIRARVVPPKGNALVGLLTILAAEMDKARQAT